MKDTFNIVPASNGPLWLFLGLAVFLLGLLAVFGYLAYSSKNTRFEVSEENLRIAGDLYGRTIPIDSLEMDRAKTVDLTTEPPYMPTIRTNGAGLPGYLSGWFRLRNGEKALLFVTDKRWVVYIPTRRGYSLLLSVRNTDDFLSALRAAA